MSTRASAWLDERHIPHRTFVHQGEINSLEQVAQERNQRPDQIIRSILFRLSDSEFVLVLAAGPEQISWPLLRHYLNRKRITMAADEEVERITGARPGAVSPFGLPNPVRILADPSIFAPDEVSLGSGTRGTAIILTREDFQKALGNIEIVPLMQKENLAE